MHVNIRNMTLCAVLALSFGSSSAFAQTAPNVTEPQAFADLAGSSNMFEVESSQLALAQATSDDVKAFAQHMIEDHTAAGEKMKAAAAKDGVTPPATMAAKEHAQLEQLQAAEGEAFNAAYVAAQATAHDEAVALFETFSTQGEESALRGFAAETLPTLQEHQAMVSKLGVTN
jgi:putative membrane protein